jgi:hypothetical protein
MVRLSRSVLIAMCLILSLVTASQAGESDAHKVISAAIKALECDLKPCQFKAAVGEARGTIHVAGQSYPCKVHLIYQPPSQYSLTILGDSFKIATVLNGDLGWIRLNNLVRAMSKEQLDEARETMYAEKVTALVPLLKGEEYVLRLLGNVVIENKHAVGVKVRHRKQRDVNLFFDMKSGLLIKVETTVKENGTTMLQELFLENWERFGSVRRPRCVVTKRDRKDYSTLRLIEYKALEKKIGEGAFVRPIR